MWGLEPKTQDIRAWSIRSILSLSRDRRYRYQVKVPNLTYTVWDYKPIMPSQILRRVTTTTPDNIAFVAMSWVHTFNPWYASWDVYLVHHLHEPTSRWTEISEYLPTFYHTRYSEYRIGPVQYVDKNHQSFCLYFILTCLKSLCG